MEPVVPSPRVAAEALLARWHAPGLGRIVTCTDPHVSHHLSPDAGSEGGSGGELVAFTGSRQDRPEGPAVSRLCVVPLTGGEPVEVGSWPGGTRAGRWSPDGRRLAFTSDRRQPGLHRLAFVDRRNLHDPVDGPDLPGTVETLAWSPTGAEVLVTVAGYGAQIAGAMASGRVPFPAPGRAVASWEPHVRTSPTEGDWRRLWTVDATTGVPTCVTANGPCVWEAAWSGAGAFVAVVSDTPDEDAWYGARVSLLDRTGAERTLVTSDRQLGIPAGSASGRWAACVEAVCSDRTLVAGRLVVVDLDSGAQLRPDLGFDATHLVFRDDVLVVSGVHGMRTRIAEVDPGSGSVTVRWDTPTCVGPRQPEVALTSDGFVATTESWDEPPYVVHVRPGAGTDGAADERLVWSSAHDGTRALRATLPELEIRRWSAPDGWEIEGLVVRPAGEGPHPLVLYPHGGPVAMYRPRFATGTPLVPLLLDRGYAVLMPNPRGSCGYGWDFADAVHGDMGGADTDDLLTGIDALVADGVADPDRLAVTGGSYAGYMTAWLVTRTQRFRAAVASAPVTNWYSQHFTSNIGQWDVRFLADAMDVPGGLYWQRSPVFHVADCTTPTMLTVGAHDRCTPPDQAIEFHEALREHGVPTELVIYPEDAHNVPRGPGLVDWLDRTVRWFERWCPPR